MSLSFLEICPSNVCFLIWSVKYICYINLHTCLQAFPVRSTSPPKGRLSCDDPNSGLSWRIWWPYHERKLNGTAGTKSHGKSAVSITKFVTCPKNLARYSGWFRNRTSAVKIRVAKFSVFRKDFRKQLTLVRTCKLHRGTRFEC